MSDALKTKYKYIEFIQESNIHLINPLWRCVNRKHKNELCIIEYDSEWKQYVMVAVNRHAIFSRDCLADIVDFLFHLNCFSNKGNEAMKYKITMNKGKKINYSVKDNMPITPCPNNVILTDGEPVMVGSVACGYCNKNGGYNQDKQFIFCRKGVK
jgi:hypothetical protein